jgi:hypothetical protein
MTARIVPGAAIVNEANVSFWRFLDHTAIPRGQIACELGMRYDESYRVCSDPLLEITATLTSARAAPSGSNGRNPVRSSGLDRAKRR